MDEESWLDIVLLSLEIAFSQGKISEQSYSDAVLKTLEYYQ